MIKIIVATGKNNEIGYNGKLLWKLPKDMNWFKKNTLNSNVIMGRKTYDSLSKKPLPNRKNIILTRNKKLKYENILIFNNINDILNYIKNYKNNFIIGGSDIYKLFLPFTEEIYLTKINSFFKNADTFFPNLNENWTTFYTEKHLKDSNNEYDLTFYKLKKNNIK